MTLAGLSPAGALIVRAGEPFALRIILTDAQGVPQDLNGRLFAVAFRRSAVTDPFLIMNAELSGDGFAADVLATSSSATQIYGLGQSAALSYDIVELTGGASVTRFSERVSVEPGPDFPSDIVPVVIDLPIAQVLLSPNAIAITERGAQGFGAERRLYEAGLIDEPTVDKMDARYLQAGAEGAKPFADAAEAARDIAIEKSDKAQLSAGNAQDNADRAELAALQAVIAGPYATIAEGLAATVDEEVFAVFGAGNVYATSYVNQAGSAALLGSYPSKSALDAVSSIVSVQQDDDLLALTDDDGFEAGKLTRQGIELPELTVVWSEGVGLEILDRDGFVIEVVRADGSVGGLIPSSALGIDLLFSLMDDDGYLVDMTPGAASLATDDQTIYGQRDAANLAASALLKARTIPTDIAGFFWDYTLVAGLGQSLMFGTESWPRLTKTQHLNNSMIGGGVRSGASPTNANFAPIGGSATLQPHIAVVQNPSTYAVMTDAEVSALSFGALNSGETYLEGAANAFKRLWNASRGYLDDMSRRLISAVSGFGSKTVAELGDQGQFWQELTSHCAAARNRATSDGRSSGVMALDYAQGENDYSPAATSEAVWRSTWLDQVYAPFVADVATGIFAQALRPAFFFWGVSPNARRDQNGTSEVNSIDMAQVGIARDYDNVYLIGPNYHVPDKGVHLTSNGTRWMANVAGKVRHRVLAERRPWRPLEPRWEAEGGPVRVVGNILSIDMFVPEPPLKWFQPYVGRTATDYPGKGFTVRDDQGVITFTPRLVLNSIVELTLSRAPVGAVWLSYAGQATYAGHGCLCDSDPFVSPDHYEYSAGSGQTVDEDIPALVGKPYPNFNACVPFRAQI